MIVFLKLNVPPCCDKLYTPPPIPLPFELASARLFPIVLLKEFTVPVSLKMPPPLVRATFPLTVLLVSVSVPLKLCTPPPPRLLGLEFRPARLFAIVLLNRFAVPELRIPPPSSPESFPLTVLLVSVSVPPTLTDRKSTRLNSSHRT